MPDLNLIDEGGIEESTTPSAPMPPKRGGGGGGSMNKMLMSVLVLLIIGTALFYLYKKGKFPFKKKAPVTVVQEEPFQEPEQQQPMATNQNPPQGAVQPVDTTSVPLLETPLVEDKSKKPDSKLVKTSGAPVKGAVTSSSVQKLTDMQGNFTVQVSAFREKQRADIIVSRLEDAGYPAYVATIPMKGVDWYTVRIGHYPTRNDAKKAVADFALELRSSYYIDRVRSK